MNIIEIIKIPRRNHLYLFMNKITKKVDKFKRTNAVLSPARKIKISIRINNRDIPIISNLLLFFLITNNAKSKGNNLVKYDPKISSLPKNDETLIPTIL